MERSNPMLAFKTVSHVRKGFASALSYKPETVDWEPVPHTYPLPTV